ncbi:hypothetical protein FGIG_01079 [Fasciola gigantica]|uniref:DNA mismatch repair proteins mutS family domain-containing protein n=1 Tax=Fasciola gigantica TaxID=46835 RepID=A0A504YSL3_FASGI|nr:hypothetical protein FGIG_01079 [Fasciola gigantica]
MKDIRELSFVLSQITSKSLVIIDGMCQSTNPEESRSLSWSICEVLSDRQTFAFIASSRTDLTRLSIVYPSIEIGHMRIEECNNAVNNEDIITGVTHPNSTFHSGSIDSRFRDQSQTNCLPLKGTSKFQTKWKFTYKLMKGASEENPYGIRMICHTSFPEDIISRAEEILRKTHPSSIPVSTSLSDKSTLNPIANATNIETNNSLMASSDVRQAGQLLERLTHHRLAFHFLRQVHRICKALKEDLDGKCQPTSDPITSEILGCLRFMRDFHRAVESGKGPLQIQH